MNDQAGCDWIVCMNPAPAAVSHRLGVNPMVIRRSRLDSMAMAGSAVRTVNCWPGLEARLRQSTADDVDMRIRTRIEERNRHERAENRGSRNHDWHMVKQETPPLVAIRAERLNPRWLG